MESRRSSSSGNTANSPVLEKYEQLCNYLEKETVGTEVLIYGTSGLLLVAAFIKRRPTYLVRPFKKPSHIPDQLIIDRVMHTGIVRGVKQVGQDHTFLLVNHRPLIPFFASPDRVLPVKLPGVSVNGNGFSWLNDCIVGRKATFVPLAKAKGQNNGYVVGQLCLVHPPQGKSQKLLDISETLLKLRFAKYAQDAVETGAARKNAKYYQHLARVEQSTASKEAWTIWAARKPWLWKAINDMKEKYLPKQKLLPELVR